MNGSGSWQNEIDVRRELRRAEHKYKAVVKDIEKLPEADRRAVELLSAHTESVIFLVIAYCLKEDFQPESMLVGGKMADVFTALVDAKASSAIARFDGFSSVLTGLETLRGRWALIGKLANLRRDAITHLAGAREEFQKHEMAERAKLLLVERLKP